jgi:hypothetical protein
MQALFQFAQHIYEKREGSGSGRPKNMRIRIPSTGERYANKLIFILTQSMPAKAGMDRKLQ